MTAVWLVGGIAFTALALAWLTALLCAGRDMSAPDVATPDWDEARRARLQAGQPLPDELERQAAMRRAQREIRASVEHLRTPNGDVA